MIPIVIVIGSFLAMEAVSYGSHRWLMHGPGMGWHRSHHVPSSGGWERNDLFPLCFSAAGVGIFAAAAIWPSGRPLTWVGLGVTLYGMAYLFVHEIVIHARLAVVVPEWAYFRWLRDSHRIHHLYGGEPYGMLVPLVPRSLRSRAAASDREPLERRTRVARTRL